MTRDNRRETGVGETKRLETVGRFIRLASIVSCLMLAVAGCKSFYENSGSSVRVGTLTAPIELSDGTDSFSCRLLYSMDGAYAYTRKDSKVTVIYDNVYTNTYIGCVATKGAQHLRVDVEPLDVSGVREAELASQDSGTNAVEAVVK